MGVMAACDAFGEREATLSVPVQLRCRRSTQSALFSFLDVDGSVAVAAMLKPRRPEVGACGTHRTHRTLLGRQGPAAKPCQFWSRSRVSAWSHKRRRAPGRRVEDFDCTNSGKFCRVQTQAGRGGCLQDEASGCGGPTGLGRSGDDPGLKRMMRKRKRMMMIDLGCPRVFSIWGPGHKKWNLLAVTR